jgi:hypothetical protein
MLENHPESNQKGVLTMIAVIIVEGIAGEDQRVIGPFATGELANRWGFMHLEGKERWYWLPLEAPR